MSTTMDAALLPFKSHDTSKGRAQLFLDREP